MSGMVYIEFDWWWLGSRHLERQGNCREGYLRDRFNPGQCCSSFYFANKAKLENGVGYGAHKNVQCIFTLSVAVLSDSVSISFCPEPLTSELPFPFQLASMPVTLPKPF